MKLETDRLIIRKYTRDDAAFIFDLLNSEGWLKYIGDRNINTIEDAKCYLENNYLTCYNKQEYGPYLVLLKNGTPIGSAGLYKREDLASPDIGFAFLPEFMNKGYAYEAASAVMEYAFEELGLTGIVGFTLPDNVPSIKLLQKLGLSKIGYYNYGVDENLILFSN